MEENIIRWIHYDDKIKILNEKIKNLREKKNNIHDQIFDELLLSNRDTFPKFSIDNINTLICPQTTNVYENYTNKFMEECFSEYFNSKEEASKLIEFMKSKRKIEKKYILKRDVLK